MTGARESDPQNGVFSIDRRFLFESIACHEPSAVRAAPMFSRAPLTDGWGTHKMTQNPKSKVCASRSALGWVLSMMMLGSTAVQAADSPDSERARMMKECTGAAYEDCIVRNFKDTTEASIIRGKIAFRHYCVLCHGAGGLGDGRAARIHNPKPANLTRSRVPTEYLSMIIRKGGGAIGRSPAMPPWGEQLTDEQVRDVIQYLLTIRKNT